MQGDPARFVVSKYTNSGFGDHLSCLFGAWLFARRTGRTLAVDWRGSRFNPTPGRNCFEAFFAPRAALAGVKLIADDRVAGLDYPTPIHPPKWTAQSLTGLRHVPHSAAEIAEINALVARGGDRPEPTVAINQHISAEMPTADLRKLLADLQFAPDIERAADKFIDRAAGGAPLIGVHLRHGNGENIRWRAAYWLDPPSLARQLWRNKRADIHKAGAVTGPFHDNMPPSLTARPGASVVERALYARVSREARRLAAEAGLKGARLFLCTDAPRVEAGMRRAHGEVLTFPKTMLNAGGGPLHQIGADAAPVDAAFVREMAIEMALLRRASALIAIPSQFTLMPRLELPDDHVVSLRPPLINRAVARLMR